MVVSQMFRTLQETRDNLITCVKINDPTHKLNLLPLSVRKRKSREDYVTTVVRDLYRVLPPLLLRIGTKGLYPTREERRFFIQTQYEYEFLKEEVVVFYL